MWKWLVLQLVLWNIVTPQPQTDDKNNGRQTRQLDFGECCPCPGPVRAGQDQELGTSSWAGVDDCPCRLRDVDSEGSPSILLPRVSRPLQPDDVMPTDPKEEPKPLLHPEVDLASSVLETLREVTDEEYEDALARDAAKSATKEEEPDVINGAFPHKDDNVVTLIVNPEDNNDVVSEASQVLESRCVHPSERKFKQMRKPTVYKELIITEPGALDSDMEDGASNIEERIASMNNGLGILKLKTKPEVLNLIEQRAKDLRNKLKLPGLNNLKKNDRKTIIDLSQAKVPDLQFKHLHLLKDKLNQKPTQKISFNLAHKIHSNFVRDSNTSPSILKENIANNAIGDSISPKFELKSLFDSDNKKRTRVRPLTLPNLLNLRDVEFISPKSGKPLFPELKLFKVSENKSLAKDVNKNKKCDSKIEDTTSNIQVISKSVGTEILDAVPSPSDSYDITALPSEKIMPQSSDNHDKTTLLPDNDDDLSGIEEDVPPSLDHQAVTTLSSDDTEVTILPTENQEITTLSSVSQKVTTLPTEESNKLSQSPFKCGCTSSSPQDVIELPTTVVTVTKPVILQPNNQNNSLEETNFIETISETEREDDLNNETDYDVNDLETGTSNVEPIITEQLTDYIDESLLDELDDTFERELGEKQSDGQDPVIDFSNDDSQQEIQEGENANADNSSENTKRIQGFEDKTNANKLKKMNLNVHENILMKLRNLNTPDRKILSVSKINRLTGDESKKISELGNESLEHNENSDQDFQTQTPETNETENNVTNGEHVTINPLNLQDIQNLSNSLLDATNIDKQPISIDKKKVKTDKFQCHANNNNNNEDINDNFKSLEQPDEDDSELADINLADTIQETEILNFPLEQAENSNNIAIENQSNERINEESSKIEETSCVQNLDIEKAKIQQLSSGSKSNEMSTGASERIMKISHEREASNSLLGPLLPMPSLLPPLPGLDRSNLFLGPTQPVNLPPLNFNAPLPTLADIHTNIQNVLNPYQENERDEESSSELSSECLNAEPETGASTKYNTLLPPLRSFEDLNLDIFQFSPLTQTGPFSQKIPGLNLNSFKAKVDIPKGFKIRPLKLESTLGKNHDLLGASLSFGPTKVASGFPPPLFGSDLLSSPLGSLPTLDAFKANAKNLLSSPLVDTPNLLADNLRSSSTISEITDNLRSHTENAVKNLHKTLGSTLNNRHIGNLNGFGEKLAMPQTDLLEKIAIAHDDMHDKLQGLHTDLNDRLTSFHENLMDQSKLPLFRIPLIPEFRINSRYIGNDLRSSPTKLKTQQPSSIRKGFQKKTTIQKSTQSKLRSGSTLSGKTKNQNTFKPSKLSKSASTLTPKRVEVPKVTATSSKPPVFKPLQRDSYIKLINRKPIESFRSSKNLLPKNFGNFKVSIATTPKPSTTKPQNLRKPFSQFQSKSSAVSRSQTQRKTSDSSGFASGVKSSIISAPRIPKSQTNSEDTVWKAFTPRLQEKVQNIAKYSRKYGPPISKSRFRVSVPHSHVKIEHLEPTPKPLPKLTESPLIAKVRETLRAKQANTGGKQLLQGLGSSKYTSDQDMARSASENKEVAVSNPPLNENVPYKCKMVCFRDSSGLK